MAVITVEPKNSFVDESLAIKVSDLRESQPVTLLSRQRNERGQEFHSYAYYEADEDGIVDLTINPALGGFYKGVQPMGLFFTMKKKGYSALFKQDVSIHDKVTICVLDGHQNIGMELSTAEQFLPLGSIEIQRQYLDPQIDRIVINSGDLRGTLFLPQREEEIPGVIDIAGVVGGVMEGRAALIARRGFAVFGLSLFGLPGQPKHPSIIDLEVIEQAIDFLQRQRGVSERGVGIIGLSLGGTVGLAATGCIPKIACVVNISGPVFAHNVADLKYKEKVWNKVIGDSTKVKIKDGLRHVNESYTTPHCSNLHNHMPDFHRSKASILFQHGEADKLLNVHPNIRLARAMFESSRKENYQFKIYPGAGHVIYIPNIPNVEAAYLSPSHTNPTYMGGTPLHARAQQEAWEDVFNFLTKNLYLLPSSHL